MKRGLLAAGAVAAWLMLAAIVGLLTRPGPPFGPHPAFGTPLLSGEGLKPATVRTGPSPEGRGMAIARVRTASRASHRRIPTPSRAGEGGQVARDDIVPLPPWRL
jgi:hypothetical protein